MNLTCPHMTRQQKLSGKRDVHAKNRLEEQIPLEDNRSVGNHHFTRREGEESLSQCRGYRVLESRLPKPPKKETDAVMWLKYVVRGGVVPGSTGAVDHAGDEEQ